MTRRQVDNPGTRAAGVDLPGDVITRTKRRWSVTPSLLALAALLLSSLPYACGYAVRPEGTRFWAVPPFNAEDANQYLAFSRAVARGEWLVGNPFTAEAHTPRLFLPEAVLQAALSRAFGWTPLEVFQVTRVAFGAGLLLAAWWFGTLIIRRRSLQRMYMAFVCLSAGGGWLVDLLRPGTAHGDEHQPEGNTLYLLGNLPHLILAAALLTALFATRAALGRGPMPRNGRLLLAGTALLSFLLSWTHPWDFLSLVLGTGAYALFLLVEDKKVPWTSVLHFAAVGAGAAPAALYLAWVVRVDPIYAAMANDVMVVQRWPFYVIAHGILGVPALIVLANARLRSRYALPIGWVLCVFLFLVTPFRLGGKQSRLPGGVHVPLALLAAVGVDRAARASAVAVTRRRRRPGGFAVQRSGVLSAMPRRPLARGICLGYLGLSAIGAGAILHRHWAVYARRGPDYFQTRGVQHVYEYLDRHGASDQVALGGPVTAGWAPTLADVRAYYGHWHMTIDGEGKRARRDWFFSAAATPAERAAWLADQGIAWVIWYPWEWHEELGTLDGVPGLEKALGEEDIVLYRFAG